ncbi:MAG: hypothetical protein GXY76_20510 [Chloroflexi bacterium]|nr:hypothetical protein [Chloroflexota bacterium]
MNTYIVRKARLPYDPEVNNQQFWDVADKAQVDVYRWYQSGEKWEAFAQLLYDADKLYFRMVSRNDHQIVAVSSQPNQPVYKDSCGELFISPGPDVSIGYFNFEINCVGAMLLAFGTGRQGREFLRPELARQVAVWHSVPGPTKAPSADDCCWEIQAAIPLAVLRAYVGFATPKLGDVWRANFQRCADGSANPQWATWNPIETPQADFHRPEFFGQLLFA